MIALVDYRAGNLTSIRKALAAVGLAVFTPTTPDQLDRASGVIIPGVGNFKATAILDHSWRAALLEAFARGRPLLGICLGLQYLFEGSAEAPELRGLGLLPGRCRRLRSRDGTERLKVPHVGWNSVSVVRASTILGGLPEETYAYFTHSYAAPVTDACVATTTHGDRFASVVERGAIFGAQFHPEKSGDAGLQLLRNFGARVAAAG